MHVSLNSSPCSIDFRILIRKYTLHLDILSQLFLWLSESLPKVSMLESQLLKQLHLGQHHLLEVISTK